MKIPQNFEPLCGLKQLKPTKSKDSHNDLWLRMLLSGALGGEDWMMPTCIKMEWQLTISPLDPSISKTPGDVSFENKEGEAAKLFFFFFFFGIGWCFFFFRFLSLKNNPEKTVPWVRKSWGSQHLWLSFCVGWDAPDAVRDDGFGWQVELFHDGTLWFFKPLYDFYDTLYIGKILVGWMDQWRWFYWVSWWRIVSCRPK